MAETFRPLAGVKVALGFWKELESDMDDGVDDKPVRSESQTHSHELHSTGRLLSEQV